MEYTGEKQRFSVDEMTIENGHRLMVECINDLADVVCYEGEEDSSSSRECIEQKWRITANYFRKTGDIDYEGTPWSFKVQHSEYTTTQEIL